MLPFTGRCAPTGVVAHDPMASSSLNSGLSSPPLSEPSPVSTAGSLQRKVIQRYAQSQEGDYNVSENGVFAVPTTDYTHDLLTNNGPPAALGGDLDWNPGGNVQIDGAAYTRYTANLSRYEEEDRVGSEQGCGLFARGITNNINAENGPDRSSGDEGSVLKYGDTSPGMEDGWKNHFASVVKKDGGDHATFETAVGIEETWVGIYGRQRGQTFKYKTQVANIDRLEAMDDIVLPGQGPELPQSFFEWLTCQRPNKADAIVPRGISEEQAKAYRDELTAWRDHDTPPTSQFITDVVAQLVDE